MVELLMNFDNFSCQVEGVKDSSMVKQTHLLKETRQVMQLASARSLPNEDIVQKIEEVLSGVLDTELRYKPGKLKIIICLESYNFKNS